MTDELCDPAPTFTLSVGAADYLLRSIAHEWLVGMDDERRSAWLDYYEIAGELQSPERLIARLLDGAGEGAKTD